MELPTLIEALEADVMQRMEAAELATGLTPQDIINGMSNHELISAISRVVAAE